MIGWNRFVKSCIWMNSGASYIFTPPPPRQLSDEGHVFSRACPSFCLRGGLVGVPCDHYPMMHWTSLWRPPDLGPEDPPVMQ